MTRYREISTAEMTSAQKEVHDEIVAGRRGRFGGPFQILIRAPEVCRHLQRLGEYLRWGSSLPPALSELAICLTAHHLRVSLEWHAHAPLGVEAGVSAAAIEAIRTGATPSFTAPDQALVHRIVTELISTKRLTDATFAEAIARFGEQGVVELGTIVGYYTAIGNALNAFQVPLPAGAPQPFPE
ncbi:MAG TPA: carboxymuconolactone decarboxylase family protein [Bradyrhizobium sp.]|uniref:carboxymuconolactone decarboxylase family protein n=1 Tax=Bradyrhizobium sp. TaxID=376 RepID=UPI002D7E60E9|nr:carboxymuconolactone decarboxylase family protein [Bradyrhizobium sp.]HET7885075.1 carboxymuconolactone decarboxylase family protein [Bradyrhizobium sp.]